LVNRPQGGFLAAVARRGDRALRRLRQSRPYG
jgi:hypothetical protein